MEKSDRGADVPWSEEFERLVNAHLDNPQPLGSMEPDLSLLAAGLDSLEAIGLIIELEDSFGMTLPDDLLSIETFSTPSLLWTAIASCLPSVEVNDAEH